VETREPKRKREGKQFKKRANIALRGDIKEAIVTVTF
jgi:hypothetical protein